MEIIGYLAAVLIGIVLGVLGGGGSILTVPILVYLMSVPAVTATGYSLLIVGRQTIKVIISTLGLYQIAQ